MPCALQRETDLVRRERHPGLGRQRVDDGDRDTRPAVAQFIHGHGFHPIGLGRNSNSKIVIEFRKAAMMQISVAGLI